FKEYLVLIPITRVAVASQWRELNSRFVSGNGTRLRPAKAVCSRLQREIGFVIVSSPPWERSLRQ
ncbi:MAG: hypothetical protein KDB01_01075, partial [Planctomycetaceae bacterium]|nr:hypothetical protein [Planctomycetaceae bacterium]